MNALNQPVYELLPTSKEYKSRKKLRDDREAMDKILKIISKRSGVDQRDINYYKNGRFGILADARGFKKFRSEIMKSPDKNGVYLFKKTSDIYKQNAAHLQELANYHSQVDPFGLHDVFGLNNFKRSQIIGDRLFVEVVSESSVPEKTKDEWKQVPYEEYLEIFTQILKEEKKNNG